ncbi:MAG: PQQ-like beta-propeller repeat protein [Pirellulales bacterium]|nr:PQQ-like beta-propeller repeat protein [Pirellulales bacterium]
MSHAESAAVPAAPRVRRRWFPWVVLAISAVVMAALVLIPTENLDRGIRNSILFVVVGASGLALILWLLLASGLSGHLRLLLAISLVAVGLALYLAIDRIEYSGDMHPTIVWRLGKSRSDALESHRQQHAADATAFSADELAVRPNDCPEYRGIHRDGVVPDPPQLARDWAKTPPKLAWKQPVGGGYAGFVVVGPMLVTIEQRRDQEAVVAYDAESGRQRWLVEYPALFHETLGGDGPRATPTLADDRLYALGATGVLLCLKPEDGSEIWRHDILQTNHAVNLQWGMCGSPLVYENWVVVNPGDQQPPGAAAAADSHALLAFDRTTGNLAWAGGHGRASYASPMLLDVAGKRQLVVFDTPGLAGHDPADGRELWRVLWPSNFDINAAQPLLVAPNRLLISSDSGAAVIEVAEADGQWTAREVWRNNFLKCSYANPLLYEGYVYGLNKGILTCLEVATGKRVWQGGRYGHGQMLLCGDLLVILAESGELVLVEATPEAHRELGRIQAIEGKTWNNPAMVGPRIYVRNHIEMAAYDLPVESATNQ